MALPPPGSRDLPEWARPLETTAFHAENLASPYRAVRAETGPVECKTYNRPFDPVLRHDSGDMCVVVLDPCSRQPLLCERPLGAQVIRVQVVYNEFGIDLQNAFEMLYGVFERTERLQIFEVPYVLA